MSPDALAARHPRLYHQTRAGAWPQIRAHGLLPTAQLLARTDLPAAERQHLTRSRRAAGITLSSDIGPIEINDNIPLSHAALERCLDDGLTPAQWCAMLAERVFFWADESSLARLLGARTNRDRPRDVLVIDTLSFARAHQDRIELSPINSGSTIRKPARRGLSTYAPMRTFESYADWARLRLERGEKRAPDRIKEVVVPGAVTDIAHHVVKLRRYEGGTWRSLSD